MTTGTRLDGTWDLVVGTPRGDRPAVLLLAAGGAMVTGTRNGRAIEDVARRDGTLVFAARLTGPARVKVRCTVTIDGDSTSGKAATAGLPVRATVSGTRRTA